MEGGRGKDQISYLRNGVEVTQSLCPPPVNGHMQSRDQLHHPLLHIWQYLMAALTQGPVPESSAPLLPKAWETGECIGGVVVWLVANKVLTGARSLSWQLFLSLFLSFLFILTKDLFLGGPSFETEHCMCQH